MKPGVSGGMLRSLRELSRVASLLEVVHPIRKRSRELRTHERLHGIFVFFQFIPDEVHLSFASRRRFLAVPDMTKYQYQALTYTFK